MTEPLKNGDEVRVKATGQVGILTDVNPNPNWEADDEVWAEFESPGDFIRYIDGPDDVELVRRAEDIPAKTLPSLAELVDDFSSSLHSGFGAIRVTETDPNGEPEGQFLAYGVSATGQRFGCRVTISDIEWADF